MRRASAQPSASGPRTSHRNSGTPASRSMLSRLGTVHTRLRVESSATSRLSAGCLPGATLRHVLEASGVAAVVDQPHDTFLQARPHVGGSAGTPDDVSLL